MYTGRRCSGSCLLGGLVGAQRTLQLQSAPGSHWALRAIPQELEGPVATPGEEVGCQPLAEQTCAEFRGCHGQACC